MTFIGTSIFSNNSAESGGAIVTFDNVVLTFNGTNNFTGNSANLDGGAIYIDTNISLNFTGTSSFSSNSAMEGGAITANHNTTLIFNGNIHFTNNRHKINNGESHGGALYLSISATLNILPHTTVCWENNHANLGGAIYVNPLTYCPTIIKYIPKEECFFQLPGQNLNHIDSKLIFKNNSAVAGSVLYGGAIDNCKLNGLDSSISSGEVFDKLLHIEDNYRTTSKISSDPIHICLCKNDLPDCSGSRKHRLINSGVPYLVYPGETFQVYVVATGQRDQTVPSTVRSMVRTVKEPGQLAKSINSGPANLLDYQYLQQTNNPCTKLNYTVFSLSQKLIIKLHPEVSTSCSKHTGGALYFLLTINQNCPPGFIISESARSCVCEPRLAQYTNSCNITNGVGRITRESGKQFWVGFNNELIFHPQCPFDYCVNDPKVFPLNNTDVQCKHNRSGLLCGHCKEGYSLVLGTH